jgi:hypothetical protein
MNHLTGLFLGAGASYEVGMPLVWDLTEELKRWLTPEKLRQLNVVWRAQGGGHPDQVIEDFVSVLQRHELHYESLLGYLETQYRRHQPNQQDYHGLYSWLVQMVYYILYARHVNNPGFIARHLSLYAGIRALAERNTPLWVFSLNHDLIVEAIAADFGIPIHSGFNAQTIALPRRDKSGKKIGELRAHVLGEQELEKGALYFPNPPVEGIYLVKIHGALDVFTFNEGRDLLKLAPSENTPASILEALRAANEELFFPVPGAPMGRAHAMNEIAYADDTGEMQFLRRTLLAGAYKFDERHHQVLPRSMLKQFRDNINFVSRLLCVGYGFGDLHINAVIRQWLEFTSARHLEIVSPSASGIPPFLLHVAPQVTVVKSGAADYFDAVGEITRTRREKLEKRLEAYARRHGKEHTSKKMAAFQTTDLRRVYSAMFESFRGTFGRRADATEGSPSSMEDFSATLNSVTDDVLERMVDFLEKPDGC